MIDIENQVYSKIRAELLEDYPKIYMPEAYTPQVSTFPCVIVEEKTNTPNLESITTHNTENYSNLMYEINIYTNSSTKKTEAKAIRDKVNDIMMNYFGMERSYCSNIPNLVDSSIYRIVLRYTCKVDNNTKVIYRR